jgi:mitochondrial fission protein ELM1
MPASILIVSDGKQGHVHQSIALCENLGAAYDLAEVRYPAAVCKAASYLLDRLGLRCPWLYRLRMPENPGHYAAVAGTGSTAFYPVKVLARTLGLPCAAILTPRGYRMDFDCILAPAFDRQPQRPNLVTLPVNLTPTRPEFYARGTEAFLVRHTPRRPAVGVILGGPNSFASLHARDLEPELTRLFACTPDQEHWVTTSRRTPPEVDALVDRFPFDYRLVFSRDPFNPIPAFVMLCETLFVTADSTSMISEAVTHGRAAVEILMNLNGRPSKFAALVEHLAAAGAVHRFDGTLGQARQKIDLQPAFRRVAALLRLG